MTDLARESFGPPRIYCAVAQLPEGGVPVTAITTVHKDDYDELLHQFDLYASARFRLRQALLGMVALYRDDTGEVVYEKGASQADDALAEALAVLYPGEREDGAA